MGTLALSYKLKCFDFLKKQPSKDKFHPIQSEPAVERLYTVINHSLYLTKSTKFFQVSTNMHKVVWYQTKEAQKDR